MDSRPEWERTLTDQGGPGAGRPTTAADTDDDVLVLPDSPVVAPLPRVINWGAPDPAARLAPARPSRPRPTARRLFSTIVMVCCFTAMALLLVSVVADWGARSYEMDALLDEIEISEGIMLDAKERVTGIIGGNPDITGEDTREELQRLAAEADAALAESAERIAAISLLAWHDQLAAARSAYLAHSAAWQQYLSAAAGDATQWFELYPQIDLTWEALAPQLRSAVPAPSFWGTDDRVASILGGSEQATEPQQLDA